MAASDIVVIMDFDKTIIDCDSDNWVVDELGATRLFNQLLQMKELVSSMKKAGQGSSLSMISANIPMDAIIPALQTCARIQASLFAMEEKKTIIYMGDGLGDFCPSLKLRDRDYMLPRKDFPVWDLICKNRNQIQAKVCEWSNGEEFEHVLLHLISKISNDNTAQLYSEYCKLQTIPGAAYKAFTKTLYVPH
ncbi:hypothetical protein V6N13_073084 [Hibiscus sabdariffa]|uniref:Phosphatase n=1 Tax=Hibiscus sabdariffa TaxID=183260 RepID=A0ABR2E8I6_9ROSI